MNWAASLLSASLIVLPATPLDLTLDDGSESQHSLAFSGSVVDGSLHTETVVNTAAADKDAVNAELAPTGTKIAPLDWCRMGTNLPAGGVCSWIEDGIVYLERVGDLTFSVNMKRDPYEALDAEPTQIVVTWADVFTLPIQSGTIDPQLRDNGTHIINLGLPTQSTATEHTLTATLLDTPVEIHLTPVQWAWDFGEDIPGLTTEVPGGHYPDMTVAPVYQHVQDDLTITATITWQGEYRIGDSTTWFPISGYGTTTATSAPFSTYQYRTYLLPSPTYNGPGPTWAEDH